MANKDMITLLRKLAEVGKEVNTVAKNGHNEKQHYDYACEADFKREVRGPFFSKGLVIIPEILERSNYEVPTQSGGSMRYVDVTVKYTVYDSETGESLSGSSTGTGSDMGDKAVYKAMAGAFKYWLSQSNMIPTGDDPEDDSGEKKNGTSTNGQKPATNGQTQGVPHSQDPAYGANTKLTFGRHKGETLAEIHVSEPGYINYLASEKNDKPYGQTAKALAIAFLAAQPAEQSVGIAPDWPDFWMKMHDVGLSSSSQQDKEFIYMKAAVLFNVNGMINKLTDVIKSQTDADLLFKTVSDSLAVKDPDVPANWNFEAQL